MLLWSCDLSHVRLPLIDFFRTSGAATRNDVADKRLGFHDADVRFLRDCEQIVHDVAQGAAVVSPVIGKSDLVNGTALYPDGTHASGYHDASLDYGAGRVDA